MKVKKREQEKKIKQQQKKNRQRFQLSLFQIPKFFLVIPQYCQNLVKNKKKFVYNLPYPICFWGLFVVRKKYYTP